MRRFWTASLVLGVCFLFLVNTSGQQSEQELRALVAKIVASWETFDLSKIEPYYAADADLAYFDLAPFAWATFTFGADITTKQGSTSHLDGRWTMVLEKRAKGWIVVHEHVSAPLGGS